MMISTPETKLDKNTIGQAPNNYGQFTSPQSQHSKKLTTSKVTDEQVAALVDEMGELRRDMRVLISAIKQLAESNEILSDSIVENATQESTPDNYDMSDDQIIDLFNKHAVGKTFYPSDFAFEHGLDYESVRRVVEKLRAEGKIRDVET